MAAAEILQNVVFYVLAGAALAGAVAVAASRNIVRSAFALLAVLFSAAALYALMKADFIAAAQVLIYVGGILVLIIFAVMLTHKITDVKLSNDSTPGPAAFCACLCLLFSLVVVILFTSKWKRDGDEVHVMSGGREIYLRQYQADGKTGLARGGNSFEDSVVLSVQIPDKSAEGNVVEIIRTHGKEEPVHKLVPVTGSDWTPVALEKLPEGEHRWTAKIQGAAEPTVPAAESSFKVYRGVTEPIAWALAGPYLFAFEVVSVLLLAALVGAAFLARKEVRE